MIDDYQKLIISQYVDYNQPNTNKKGLVESQRKWLCGFSTGYNPSQMSTLKPYYTHLIWHTR